MPDANDSARAMIELAEWLDSLTPEQERHFLAYMSGYNPVAMRNARIAYERAFGVTE